MVVEEGKWKGAPVRSHDTMYALANADKNKVKIMFHHGAHLTDSDRLFTPHCDRQPCWTR